jgi:hypothetical protein
MSKVKFGGFAAYTSHLCRAFRQCGHECNIYKIRVRTERNERDFLDGIGSTNISIEDALIVIKNSDYAIVTATFWRGWHEPISKLIEAGCEVVLHDHTDYRGDFKDFLQTYGVRPVVIRIANYTNLHRDGLDPVYIPHPYVQFQTHKVPRDVHAVSVCRLDYDKHTDILIRANEHLPKDKQIQLWGAHTRMYMFQKVVGKYKGWNDNKHYTGPNYPREQQTFPSTPGFAVMLNRRAEFSCDMSAIKGDGGGTQYSFLEAINGNAVLVLNRKWFVNSDDELIENFNCLAVDDDKQLASLLKLQSWGDFQTIRANARVVLDDHGSEYVVKRWIKFLRGKI